METTLVSGFVKQFGEVLLPDGGARVRAVAAGFVADGQVDEPAVLYFLA